MDIHEFLAINRLHFANIDLLHQALTHRSYVNERPEDDLTDNERLEFLGDAVLDFIVGDMLYRRFTNLPEGNLTRLRAALVRTESLASMARAIHLGETLYMGKGEEANGGRERPSNLCDAFEAFVGALYLDQGLAPVREFVQPLLEPLLQQTLARDTDQDARSLLQEWSQAQHGLTPQYRTIGETGPDHEKVFTVEVLVGDAVVGIGTGRSKQAAAQAAAQNALDTL